MTNEEFNKRVFDILLTFEVLNEFGNTEILSKTELKQIDKLKMQNCLEKISKFNNHLNKIKHEESLQHGQNDQITTESI
jgi:hypothetical protein